MTQKQKLDFIHVIKVSYMSAQLHFYRKLIDKVLD